MIRLSQIKNTLEEIVLNERRSDSALFRGLVCHLAIPSALSNMLSCNVIELRKHCTGRKAGLQPIELLQSFPNPSIQDGSIQGQTRQGYPLIRLDKSNT